jgi:hypothetical protein
MKFDFEGSYDDLLSSWVINRRCTFLESKLAELKEKKQNFKIINKAFKFENK